uniref:Uncharacterized protein n=1 Tax=Arundo donax TaxID=35708 RepID=A0A0A8Z9A6_ARUDO
MFTIIFLVIDTFSCLNVQSPRETRNVATPLDYLHFSSFSIVPFL